MIFLEKIKSLKNKKLLVNLFWSFFGQVLPLLAALICIPILVNQLGDERFGFLSIAWVLIGYFSLFDFGLGRSLTYIVAKKNAKGECPFLIINTAMIFLLMISAFVFVFFTFFSGSIISGFLNVSTSFSDEAVTATRILSAGLPFVILTIGLRGVLEAYQRFKSISLITIPCGILLFVAPVLVSFFSTSMIHILFSLVLVRIIQFAFFYINVKKMVDFSFLGRGNKQELKGLLVFGGWMTVTNIVSPLMVNMDRLLIGAKIAVNAVSHYVVPFDLITKLLVLPSAASGVLFPEFSRRIAKRQMEEAGSLLKKSIILIGLTLFFPLCFVYIFAFEILSIWISPAFAVHGYQVLKIMSIGVFLNGLAYIPFAFVQGAGRSDLTAKFHVAELIIYAPILILMIEHFGILGAAYSWCFRVGLDLLMLLFISFRST